MIHPDWFETHAPHTQLRAAPLTPRKAPLSGRVPARAAADGAPRRDRPWAGPLDGANREPAEAQRITVRVHRWVRAA